MIRSAFIALLFLWIILSSLSLARIHLRSAIADRSENENATDAAVVGAVGNHSRHENKIIASSTVDEVVVGMCNGIVSFLLGATNDDSGRQRIEYDFVLVFYVPMLTNFLSRLVWHSNTGSSGLRGKEVQKNYKPLNYNPDGKKVVHFATVDVQRFHFDWSLADKVFYTRKELTAMGQNRFDDADLIRRQRQLDDGGDGQQTEDDVDTSIKSKEAAISDLLSAALSDEDLDENVSIRGIEHIVYRDLQQEMIRRKNEARREVMNFVRASGPLANVFPVGAKRGIGEGDTVLHE
jgi:hypothetical protein